MTQKRIFILVAILLAGLILAACVVDVKQADSKTRELQIRAWGHDDGLTMLTVILANGEEITAAASHFAWYYDVPVDQTEYLMRKGLPYYDIHLWESKAPPE